MTHKQKQGAALKTKKNKDKLRTTARESPRND